MKPRPWIAATERHVDGIPFGETVRPGDAYTSVVALTDGDVDLLALIKDTADRLVRLAQRGSRRRTVRPGRPRPR